MESFRIPRINTFEEAQAALKAFDDKYWTHAPGLPTADHVFHHLYRTAGRRVPTRADMRSFAGALVEHALRLGAEASRLDATHDLRPWGAKAQNVDRMLAFHDGCGRELIARGLDTLNELLHDAAHDPSVFDGDPRLGQACDELFLVATGLVIAAERPAGVRPPKRIVIGVFMDRLAALYAKHGITLTFAPASS